MSPPQALGFAAFSGTGKTTLLRQLIPLLKAQGLKIGLIKTTHHDVDIDQPGKDSHALRLAGASPVVLSAPRRRAVIVEHADARERSLAGDLACFDGSGVDLVLVEGYRHEAIPKIELHRPSLGKPLLYPEDSTIIAIAADTPLTAPPPIPLLDLGQPERIADFILAYLDTHGHR